MPKLPRTGQTPAPDSTPSSMLEAALDWARKGWPVFPLRPKGKEPLFPSAHKDDGVKCTGECGEVGHGVHDATTDPEVITQWWTDRPRAGIGGATTGRVVIDVDFQHDGHRADSLPATREHLSGRRNGNVHIIYQAGGEVALSLTQGKLAQGVDLKAGPGAYVVLPPSIHPDTGKTYTTGNDLPEHYLTDAEVATVWDEYGAKTSAQARGAARGIKVVGTPQFQGGETDEFLTNPPERGTGQFNDWLTRVAGHYAKKYHNNRKLYAHHVRLAANGYEDCEKTLESVWASEQENNPERGATPDTGWLVSMGRELYCHARLPAKEKGASAEQGLMPYANFNLIARGVMVDEDNRRTYQVVLQTAHGDVETTINAQTLADKRKLTPWLMQYGATIAPYDPERVHPQMDPSIRLARYLESQGAPPVQVVDRLGWDAGTRQFVTHDGAIREDGPVGVHESGVIADRSKVDHKTAKYHYGFELSEAEAREVLAEVQTFHFPEVTHLFGAWWAACLLKPQAMEHTSLFPYFGVEAASGSAKTNGYFNLMVQLGGNYHGQVAATKASFRDSAATSNNGILWADDMDHPDTLQEILRAATSGGTIRKMSEDRTAVDFTLSNPLLFTGEELRVSDQKALLERGVLIHPQPPTSRKSLHKGQEHQAQWVDIVALQRRFSADRRLTGVAGWYVLHALQHQVEFGGAVALFAQEHRGRNADKYAVLRAGARLLDSLLGAEDAWEGAGETAQWVDAWVVAEIASKAGIENDSRLTQKLIPWAIRTIGEVNPDGVRPVFYARSRDQAPPVLVRVPADNSLDIPEVWVNTRLLAQAWSEAKMGRVDTRLETEESLNLQLSQVAYPAKQARKSARLSQQGIVIQYRKLQDPYAALILQRVGGDDLMD